MADPSETTLIKEVYEALDEKSELHEIPQSVPTNHTYVYESTSMSTPIHTKTVDFQPQGTMRRNPTHVQSATPAEIMQEFFNPDDERTLTALAREISRGSRGTGLDRQNTNLTRMDTIMEYDYNDPIFDPEKPEFDLYKFVRMQIRAMNEEGVQLRRAGLVVRNLNVSGTGKGLNIQATAGDVFMAPLRIGSTIKQLRSKSEKKILHRFDSLIKTGELLIVLGRPGSGCTTYLKTITGETLGLEVAEDSVIHYNGISQDIMKKRFRGEVIYNGENDVHFPHLTVGETLEFAAAVRTPQNRVKGETRQHQIDKIVKVVMLAFGLSHTRNTRVGSEFLRGVSGGERKRVSIAEMVLSRSPFCAWDNSTRGLDAATALEFVRSLRMSADLVGVCHAVAIYQASQAIYDTFDKAIVLYEGRQIYFGPTNKAREYFENMGWYCTPRQTTGDFLTSVTNPVERQAKDGFENRVPRTPQEFEEYWRNSNEYKNLQIELEAHEKDYPIGGGNTLRQFEESKVAQQADHTRSQSPYIVSIPMQVKLCTKRAYQRLWNDKVSTITTIFGQIVMALIIGSIFYGTPDSTDAFFAKGSVIFFAVLLNALIALSEINTLYDQRPIVEKHASYAFYHPFTEALAGIVADLPVKFMIAVAFNVIIYFLSGLRYRASNFFIFFLFAFIATLTMSAIFRTIAASTKTVAQALAFAGVLVLALVIYTGFVLPTPYMHPWFRWINYINPIAYAFEGLLVNEFHGREFACASFVPSYADLTGDEFICSATGAVRGERTVSGDAYAYAGYRYKYDHIWRNLGIMLAFNFFFIFTYLFATEINSGTASAAEVLVFRRGHVPAHLDAKDDEEMQKEKLAESSTADSQVANVIPPQKDIFTWKDVVYDITIKGEPRRLLDHVSGWVKPGTLTALMGVSGAGKTTLLDVLAQRTSVGVITGDMFVNGKPLDASFQRKTGYVQQQDLHLETSTVREALQFSAMLRQPRSTPKAEKLSFVEDVIKMLNMEDFAEAVVGVPGQGLNVEQRKLLTIGVELAAKPALLLFLDEPTSGLDSQSSWAIVAFLRKLADSGQAVLSTIHQPSSVLFQEFDRLLFLAKGGRTVYFGDIGQNSRTLLDYYERNGARKCDDEENPAEYMLEIVGAGASGKSTQDWHEVWKKSNEAQEVQNELQQLYEAEPPTREGPNPDDIKEFAAPFTTQLKYTTVRVFQQYWRTPEYLGGKFMLGIVSALFISFSFFKSNTSQQGVENLIFSVFMLTAIFSSLVQQIMPRFVLQRSLYEVRERPSKAYSWAAFLIANILVEIPYEILLGILVFASYMYPIYGIESSEKQVLVLLYCIQFFVFASTFAHMLIAALPDAETAGNIATIMFSLTLTFCGVMQSPGALPGFWIFMYRVSPLTYLVGGVVGTAASGRAIKCSSTETSIFNPPSGQTCGQYLANFLTEAAGELYNSDATSNCEYCSLRSTDQQLASSNIYYSQRWRNFGIFWAYIVFNIFAAVLFYYMFRVRKIDLGKVAKGPAKVLGLIGTTFGYIRKMFLKRPDESKKGREAQNGRLF